MRSAKRGWTPSEQILLQEMLEAKKSATEIGVKLNRRKEAVYARVQRLRLKRLLPSQGLSFSRRSPSASCGQSAANPFSLPPFADFEVPQQRPLIKAEVANVVTMKIRDPWTSEQDQRLRDLVDAGAEPDEIGAELDRTRDELIRRGYVIGLPLKWFKARR
jgi:hypothetical protein